MARRKKQEEHVNHERWLVSYADFITLLFAFFVVMYAVSSVNEGKFRVLSDSLNAAFRGSARALNPIQVGHTLRSPHIFGVNVSTTPDPNLRMGTPIQVSIPTPMPDVKSAPLPAGSGAGMGLDTMSAELEEAFEQLIEEGLVSVRHNQYRLEVEVNTKILFKSGSSQLAKAAVPVISKLSVILEEFDNKIQVEGFTDNQPIKSKFFPSNWELSAGRAATVVRMFSEFGVDPKRLASMGFGEHQPIADNSTAEGRSKNRRVVIVVKANPKKTGNKDFRKLRDEIEKMARIPLPDFSDDSPGPIKIAIPQIDPRVEAAEELM